MKFAYLIEPPFNYVTSDGTVTGCDVELARHVATQLKIGPFTPIKTEFASLLPGLKAGNWRMTTGLFATPERRKRALFSRPIWALPDGLLVRKGNPYGLTGYRSIAQIETARLAVIRDQAQHQTARSLGIPKNRISVFETYAQAAQAVQTGACTAYASVARAHIGFIDQNPDSDLGHVEVPQSEKPPATGSFALHPFDTELLADVNAVLADVLGSPRHRRMMASFGFSATEVDLIAPNAGQ